MATRTVSTVFQVGGEKQYRAAVQAINSELEKLNQQMKASEAMMGQQDTSYGSAQAALEKLTEMYNKQDELMGIYTTRLQNVQKAYQALGEKAEGLRVKLDGLKESMEAGDMDESAYKEAQKEFAALSKELEDTETSMLKASTEANNLQTNISKVQVEMQDLGEKIQSATDPLDEFAFEANKAGDEAEEMGDKSASATDRAVAALEELAASELFSKIQAGFEKVRDLMADCAQSYIEFETAIAGVEKTVDATAAQMDELTSGIQDMSERIPATTTEIAAVAEAAGQLGIATEDILDFTEVMINLGESTNLSATEAAEALAKFANITQLDPSDYERLGSVIVDLGNKTATTEQDIVNMATRLASTGELVGLTADEIMAMAATFSALGIEAEAGGTAAAKMLRQIEAAVSAYEPAIEVIERTGYSLRELELMQSNSSSDFKALADSIGLTSTELGKYVSNAKKLEQFAEISGATAEEFRQDWGENAVGALDQFVTGLGKIHEEGGSVTNTLSDIAGMSEVRLTNAIQSLATSGGMLTETLEIANDAWEENTALAEEAGKRYETTESKLTIFNNSLNNLKIAIGEDFNTILEPIIETGTKFVQWLADAAEETPELSSALAGLGGALAGLTGLATVATGIKAVQAALALFGATAAPVAAAVAAVAGIGAAMAVYLTNAQTLSDEAQALVDQNDALLESVEDTQEKFDASELASSDKQAQVEKLIDKVQTLSEKVNQTAGDKYVIQSAVDELNELLPGLGATFDETTGKVNLSASAMRDYADSVLEAARMEAMQDYLKELIEQQVQLEIQYDLTTSALEESETALQDAETAKQAFFDTPQSFVGYLTKLDEHNAAIREAKQDVNALTGEQEELQTAMDDLASTIDTVTDKLSEMGTSSGSTSALTRGVEEATEKYQELIDAAQEAYNATVDAAAKARDEAYDEYCEGLDDQLDYLEESNEATLKEVQRQNDAIIKAKKNAQEDEMDDLEDYLDDEMDALEKQYDAKIELIDAEYTERLKLLDEDRYNAIKQIEDEIDAIEALTEAEEKAIEEQERQKKIAQLEEAVRNAEDREEQQEAEEKLADYLNELERKRILADREERIEELKKRKETLNDEYDAKEDELKEEQKAVEKAIEEEEKLEKEALEKSQEERKKELKRQQEEELEQLQNSLDDQETALKNSQKRAEEDYKISMEEWKTAKKAELDYEYDETVKTAGEIQAKAQATADEVKRIWEETGEDIDVILSNIDSYAKGKKVGDDFVAGLNAGLDGGDQGLDLAAKNLAGSLLKTMQTELAIKSPSRKAMEIGKFFGEGLVQGLDAKADAVEEASRRMSAGMDISGDVADKVRQANREMEKMRLTADVSLNNEAVMRQSMVSLGQAATMLQNNKAVGEGGDNFYITIQADNIKELNDLIRIANEKRVQIRMGTVKG